MGSYFADKWDALSGLPAAFAANPLFFVIAFAIGLPLIWLKWRFLGKSTQTAVDKQTHGLRADAKSQQHRHDTGIGTQDVLVMRPAKLGGALWFGLIFFGGGAVFYAMVVLQDAPVTKDWWVFAGLIGFVLMTMVVFEINQTRIIVSATSIQKRRVLHRRQTIDFSNITDVDAIGENITRGLVIQSNTGDKMRVTAGFSGYLQLMERLAPHNPKIGLLAKLIEGRAHARTARG